jgi:hypothetical protein
MKGGTKGGKGEVTNLSISLEEEVYKMPWVHQGCRSRNLHFSLGKINVFKNEIITFPLRFIA